MPIVTGARVEESLGRHPYNCASNVPESEGTDARDDIRNRCDDLPCSDDESMNELRVGVEGWGCNGREGGRDEV